MRTDACTHIVDTISKRIDSVELSISDLMQGSAGLESNPPQSAATTTTSSNPGNRASGPI